MAGGLIERCVVVIVKKQNKLPVRVVCGACVVMGYRIRISYINYIHILDHRLSELYSLIRTL